MEACAAGRHGELVKSINKQLAELQRSVEGTLVSTTFDVHLAPVDISMQMPTPGQFHADINALVQRGIIATVEKHVRVHQEQAPPGRMGGMFGGGGSQRQRTQWDTTDITVYRLHGQEIIDYFMNIINDTIDRADRCGGAAGRSAAAAVGATVAMQHVHV